MGCIIWLRFRWVNCFRRLIRSWIFSKKRVNLKRVETFSEKISNLPTCKEDLWKYSTELALCETQFFWEIFSDENLWDVARWELCFGAWKNNFKRRERKKVDFFQKRRGIKNAEFSLNLKYHYILHTYFFSVLQYCLVNLIRVRVRVRVRVRDIIR